MMKTNANKLAPFLKGGALLTSSELIARLRADGISESNARQILRRQSASDGIWRSEKLKLARNERLFAVRRFVGTDAFLRAAAEKLRQTHRWGLARVLATLADQHVIHKVDILRLLAVSLQSEADTSSVTRRVYDVELEALKELGIKVIQRYTPLESLVSPAVAVDTADEAAIEAISRLRREVVLARVLTEHMRRQNLLAWNQVENGDFASPYTVFNNHVFSSTGFSYLSPLCRWNKSKNSPTPCPVLIDCYADECSIFQVESFIQRIDRVSNRGKSKMPVLGVLGARGFHSGAWIKAKKRGFLTINFRQLFGDEALEAMIVVEDVLTSLSQEGEAPTDAFTHFSQLLKDLRTNPVVTTLRSIGFEAVAGLILRAKGYEQVELGRVVPWNTTNRDVDVFGLRDNELFVIECKGYHRKKSLLEEDVTRFYSQTLPALKKWLRTNQRSFDRCTAEIWTTGSLGQVAEGMLCQLKSPEGDTWQMKRLGDLKTLIPSSIRKRSIELLESIAMADSSEPFAP